MRLRRTYAPKGEEDEAVETNDRMSQVSRARRGFIRSYGLFWHASEVDWDSRRGAPSDGKTILGRINKNAGSLRMANFWDQKGIYVLYNEHGAYYVGKTARLTLGAAPSLASHKQSARWEVGALLLVRLQSRP